MTPCLITYFHNVRREPRQMAMLFAHEDIGGLHRLGPTSLPSKRYRPSDYRSLAGTITRTYSLLGLCGVGQKLAH